jgi:hypothetical protein
MSEMSKASAPAGGDPLEVMPESGAKDDVLPGPPAGVDPTDDRPNRAGAEASDTADPGPEAGTLADPPGPSDDIDPEAGRDPLDSADTEGARTPGVGGSESGADPMPDMAGASDDPNSNPNRNRIS